MVTIIAPVGVFRKEDDKILIRWNDGTASEYATHALRCACPCAACVNEWTGEKMLDESKIPATTRPARLFSVGRYAMAVHWSDGHKTGIYSYEYLKKLDPGRP